LARFFSFEKSELELLLISITFQIVAFFTILRVATGVAAISSSQTANSSSPAIVIPRNITSSVVIPSSTPQFVSPVGSTISAGFILALIFVGANVAVIGFLAFLYRRKKMRWFSLLISLFLIFNVTELYFTFLTGLSSWVPIGASFAALVITVLAAYRGSALVTNAIALVLALELGSAFPVLLQAPLNWIIPAVYAVFDVYAVYYGRMGKLVRDVSRDEDQRHSDRLSPTVASSRSAVPSTSSSSSTESPGPSGRLSRWPDFGLLSIRLSDIEIGMADIAFYTMVPAVALLLDRVIAFIVVMVAVDIGILLSFTVFRKREVSPGLPVPILLGLGALLVVMLFVR
jgi:hypothetical protein